MSTSNPFVASDDERWFDPGPGWWLHALGLFDRAAVAGIGRDAAAAIMRIDRLGRWAHAAGLVAPTADAVAAVFPFVDPPRAERIARDSAALRFKNRAAIAILERRSIDALARLADPPEDAVAALSQHRQGAVLLAFHMGAQFGVGATLHKLGQRTLTVRNMPVGDAHERTRALRQSVDELRAGAIVIAAVDGPGGASTVPFTCLGRRIVLRRGPFMLARLTGVPLLPVVATWTSSGHIALRVGAALDARPGDPAGDVEHQLAVAAGRWFEAHLQAHPEDVWPYTLANLLATPLADTATT